MYQLLRESMDNVKAEEEEGQVEHPTHEEARRDFDPHAVAVSDPYLPGGGGSAVLVRSRAHAEPDEEEDRSKARRCESTRPKREPSPVYSPMDAPQEDAARAEEAREEDMAERQGSSGEEPYPPEEPPRDRHRYGGKAMLPGATRVRGSADKTMGRHPQK